MERFFHASSSYHNELIDQGVFLYPFLLLVKIIMVSLDPLFLPGTDRPGDGVEYVRGDPVEGVGGHSLQGRRHILTGVLGQVVKGLRGAC